MVTACGQKLSCGEGTAESADVCVPAIGDGGAPGTDKDDDKDPEVEVDFSGIRAAAAVSNTALLAVWLPSEDDDVSYEIYVSKSKGDFNYSAPQAEAPAGAASIVVTGLKSKETYFVQVRAVVDGKPVPNDKTAEVTLQSDTKPPEFSGVLDAESADGAGIKVSWEPAVDKVTPEKAIVYLVYAGETADSIDYRVPIGVSLPGEKSAIIQLPQPNTEYFVAVRARDAAGNLDENRNPLAAESGDDVEPPRFSGCSSANARSATGITVTWSPATDDIVPAEEITYHLYAATDPDKFNFAAPDVTVSGEKSATIPGLDQDTPYFAICRAADPSENVEENRLFLAARTKDDGIPPEFDGVLTPSELGTTSVQLSWSAGSDDKSDPDDLEYFVFHSQFEEDLLDFDPTDFPTIAETNPGETTALLEGLPSNTNHYVVVLARDGGENYSALTEPFPFATQVSFSIDVMAGIFGPKGCAVSSCHNGLNPTGELNLSSTLAYANLVGVPAETLLGESGNYERVTPFDIENSHLIHRLKGTGPNADAGLGDRMPLDGNLLSDTEISTVELWILQGAEDN